MEILTEHGSGPGRDLVHWASREAQKRNGAEDSALAKPLQRKVDAFGGAAGLALRQPCPSHCVSSHCPTRNAAAVGTEEGEQNLGKPLSHDAALLLECRLCPGLRQCWDAVRSTEGQVGSQKVSMFGPGFLRMRLLGCESVCLQHMSRPRREFVKFQHWRGRLCSLPAGCAEESLLTAGCIELAPKI